MMFEDAVKGFMKALVKNLSLQIQFWICMPLALAAVLFGVFDAVPTLICIGMVLTAECLNSSIEQLASFVHPQHNEVIGDIKDMAAGSVLVSVGVSVAVAIIMLVNWLSI